MRNLSINTKINDRDCWSHMSMFLNKEEVCALSKTCKGINSVIGHIPFKKLVFDWTCGTQEIKILCKYSEHIEELSVRDIDFASHLLNDYPKLKNLTLIDCEYDLYEKILKMKYMDAEISVRHERIAMRA